MDTDEHGWELGDRLCMSRPCLSTNPTNGFIALLRPRTGALRKRKNPADVKPVGLMKYWRRSTEAPLRNYLRRQQPRSGDQIVAHGATVGFIGQPSQPRMGRKKCSDDAVFLALLPELLPRCALTHSSRCGLLAHAAPAAGDADLATWATRAAWWLVGEKKNPAGVKPAGLRKSN